MKLFLALVNLINAELINTDDRAYCYAPDIYLQGPFQVQKADSLKNCNERCSNHQQCNFFQFNIRKKKCFFYRSQRKLRSSVTSTRTSIQRNALWMGKRNQCLGCFRMGWHYGDTSDIFDSWNSGIKGVATVYKCAEICFYSTSCKSVSFDKNNDVCLLYDNYPRSLDQSARYSQFVSADQYCTDEECVVKGFPQIGPHDWNIKNIIRDTRFSRALPQSIGGIGNKDNCKDICVLINGCKYFTWHFQTRECFLHKEPSHLKFDNKVTGGEANCRNTDDFGLDDYPVPGFYTTIDPR